MPETVFYSLGRPRSVISLHKGLSRVTDGVLYQESFNTIDSHIPFTFVNRTHSFVSLSSDFHKRHVMGCYSQEIQLHIIETHESVCLFVRACVNMCNLIYYIVDLCWPWIDISDDYRRQAPSLLSVFNSSFIFVHIFIRLLYLL